MKSGEWLVGIHSGRGTTWLVGELKHHIKYPFGWVYPEIKERQAARLDVFDLDDLPMIELYLGRHIQHPFRLGALEFADRLRRTAHAQEKLARIKEKRPAPKRLERSKQFFAESHSMAKRGTPGKPKPSDDGPWWENRDGLWEDEDE